MPHGAVDGPARRVSARRFPLPPSRPSPAPASPAPVPPYVPFATSEDGARSQSTLPCLGSVNLCNHSAIVSESDRVGRHARDSERAWRTTPNAGETNVSAKFRRARYPRPSFTKRSERFYAVEIYKDQLSRCNLQKHISIRTNDHVSIVCLEPSTHRQRGPRSLARSTAIRCPHFAFPTHHTPSLHASSVLPPHVGPLHPFHHI